MRSPFHFHSFYITYYIITETLNTRDYKVHMHVSQEAYKQYYYLNCLLDQIAIFHFPKGTQFINWMNILKFYIKIFDNIFEHFLVWRPDLIQRRLMPFIFTL
jgi:hypothetical protein